MVDLKDELYGEVFEPLKDMERFRFLKVVPDLKNIFWENGADLPPKFLYKKRKFLP